MAAKVEVVRMPRYAQSLSNHYRVPVKQWRKWGNKAKDVFNTVYATLKGEQAIVSHPKMPSVKEAHWNTIAWNAAWIAADAVEGV